MGEKFKFVGGDIQGSGEIVSTSNGAALEMEGAASTFGKAMGWSLAIGFVGWLIFEKGTFFGIVFGAAFVTPILLFFFGSLLSQTFDKKLFEYTQVPLSENVIYAKATKDVQEVTSAAKTAARLAFATMAGKTAASGHGGGAGFYAGLYSAMGNKKIKEQYFVDLVFTDGSSSKIQTSKKGVDTVISGVRSMSEGQVSEYFAILKDMGRIGTERTIQEISKELSEVQAEIESLKGESVNGASRAERDQAASRIPFVEEKSVALKAALSYAKEAKAKGV